jgi:pantetheine-phosphate adenylyltransferase
VLQFSHTGNIAIYPLDATACLDVAREKGKGRQFATIKASGQNEIADSLMTQKHATVVGIYPGSFDPITSGHLDVIGRGSRLCDRLIVSILKNEAKSPLFSVEERIEMMGEVLSTFDNVEVDCFDGLLVDYAKSKGARMIFRGIRAVSDYEYELQMALMNRRLEPEIETIFLLAGEQYSFISSKLVKEVIRLGGNIAGLVPPIVEQRLRERLRRVRTAAKTK